MSAIENLEQVFRLASLRWKVYPVSRPDYTGPDPGKCPWCPGGFKDATADVTVICQWAEKKPGCNWGVWPGEGVVVLDADAKHGGLEALAKLEAQYGSLPPTVCCETGGGGRHFYFTCPPDFQAKDNLCGCPGLTLIAGKGGVIVPPSVHPSGKPYVWRAAPWDKALTRATDWLLALVEMKATKNVGVDLDTLTWGGNALDFRTLGALPDGQRNGPVCRVIGIMLKSMSEEEVLEQGLAWAEVQEPPYDPEEMRRKVKSIAKAEREQQTPPPSGIEKAGSSETVSQSASRTPQTVGREASTECGLRTADGEPPTAHSGERSVGCGLRSAECEEERWGDGIVVWQCPALHADAYHGLAGQLVKAVGPATEADEPAILCSFLAAFGSAAGLGPEESECGMPHGANLFVLLVGPSAIRKGTAWTIGSWPVCQADQVWAKERLISEGFGTGEGLIYAVRDEKRETVWNPRSKDYDTNVVPGVDDKRLLVVEEEFAKALRLCKAKESILSAIIRQAFDRKPIGKLNKGESKCRCEKPHVSIVAQTTPDELKAELKGTSYLANGVVNRFLLVGVQRRRFVSRVKRPWQDALAEFEQPIAEALEHAKAVTKVTMSDEAGALWDEVYQRLETRPDDTFGRATGRASVYVLKLAMTYALVDRSATIGVEHMRAALSVWRYCEATARLIFSENNKNPPPEQERPLRFRLLDAIVDAPGISKTELHEATGKRFSADARADALAWLQQNGLAYSQECPLAQGGPPAERWYPGPDPQSADRKPHSADHEAKGTESDPQSADRTPQTVDGTDCGLRTAEAMAEASPTDCGLRSVDAETEGFAQHAEGGFVVHAKAGEHERNGETMTPQDFLTEMRTALGRWDEPKSCGRPYWRSEKEQAEWYLGYKKAQAERQQREAERQGGDDSPLTEAEFLAELRAMP